MAVKNDSSLKVLKEIGKLNTDGVFAYDLQHGTFAYANKAFTRILETSNEGLIEQPVSILRSLIKHDEEFVLKRFDEIKTKGRAKNVEVRLKFRSQEKYVSVDAFIIDGGDLLAGIVKDITNAKQHSTYIIEFGARKDTLLDMVAHNLSGPLNLTTNLLNAVDQLNKKLQYKSIDNHSRLIRENTEQCIDIINSFLHEEHMQSERVFVKENLFDVIAKAKIVVSRIKEFNEDKKIKLLSNVKELMVNADDVKFFQIIHNLLSNAVKFTGPKGRVTAEVIDQENTFTITITDDGIGIPEYLQPYIFKKNTPASREGLKGEKSIGMGLYICKKLTEMMRGKIHFESEENKGTTFKLEFPKQ